MKGGRVGFFVNNVVVDAQTQKPYPWDLNLDDMFDNYGWIINVDLVADARSSRKTASDATGGTALQAGDAFPLFPLSSDFNQDNLIVKDLASVVFPYVSSLDVRLASIRGVKADVLVSSSAKSQRLPSDKFDVALGKRFDSESFSEEHIPLAAAIEGSFKSLYARRHEKLFDELKGTRKDTLRILVQSPPTRMVVVGDGDFVLDGFLQAQDNVAFATNLVDWLVEDVSLTSIRARDVTPKPLDEVSEKTRAFVKYFDFAAPPGVVVIAGIMRIFVRAARRKKHKNRL